MGNEGFTMETKLAGPAVVSEVPTTKATEADIPHIVGNPSKYGFKFIFGKISAQKDNNDKLLANGARVVLREDAPRLELVDIALASTWFGAKNILEHANGTSYDVQSEGIVRTEILKNWHGDRKATTMDLLETELVKRVLLGMRAAGGGGGGLRFVANDGTTFKTAEEVVAYNKQITPPVFKAIDGSEHKTLLEAQQQSVAVYRANGISQKVAETLVSNMK